MKTEIEIFEVEQVGEKTFKAEYSIWENDSLANVTMQISKSKLIEYIIEEELGLFYTPDGDCVMMPAKVYLSENLREVVKGYISKGLQEAA